MNPLIHRKVVLPLLLLALAGAATTGCQMVEAKAGRAGLSVMAGEARGGTEESGDRNSGRATSVQVSETAEPVEAVDTQFVQGLAAAMRQSVELGQLGAQQAENEKLKRIGGQTAKATRQIYRDLESIAQEAGIQLAPLATPQHQASLERMRSLEGKEFDLAWAEEMLKSEAAALFQADATRPMLKAKQVQQLAMLVSPVLKYNYRKMVSAAETAGVPNERIEEVTEEAKLATQLPGSSESTSR